MEIDNLSLTASDDEVKYLISQHEVSIQRLDAEMDSLMLEIRRLQFRKSQHVDQIRLCKGRITLARRLPPELLANIFERCARDGWTRTPLTVSHVCSEWRKATEIPSVWSYLYVNLDTTDPYGKTDFWLRNAKAAPLHIQLEVQADTSHLNSIVDMFALRANQWKSFKRIIPPSEDCTFYDTGRRDQPHHGDTHSRLARVCEDTPSLQTLTISRNILPTPGTIPQHVPSLVLDLRGYRAPVFIPIEALLHLLQDLPHLQSLAITTPRDQPQAIIRTLADPLRIVALPDLHSLTVVGANEIFVLLSHLQLPQLRRISLCSSEDPLPYPHTIVGPALCQLLQQADVPLERLELYDLDLSSDDFVTCARHAPVLQELRLHESDITDDCLRGISRHCKNLNSLDLRWCGQIWGRELVELVRSRTVEEGMVPIECVTIINCSHMQEQDIFDLAEVTVCRLVMRDIDDYCFPFGCCSNERYRRRFHLRQLERGFRVGKSRRIIL
ncbi:hypothetical protein CPB85DRAFT_1440286 [Mucidula mucida]|nr:hypothetical protein CPB85DRAFT_1440286 [Mucidula mucida]